MGHAKPTITIHYGASNDDITVDGRTFIRHEFSRDERGTMRALIIEHLKKVRYFTQEAVRFRPKKRRQRRKGAKA